MNRGNAVIHKFFERQLIEFKAKMEAKWLKLFDERSEEITEVGDCKRSYDLLILNEWE